MLLSSQHATGACVLLAYCESLLYSEFTSCKKQTKNPIKSTSGTLVSACLNPNSRFVIKFSLLWLTISPC